MSIEQDTVGEKCEGNLGTKTVDSLFAETADETLRQAVEDIQLKASGRNFNFKAGWEKSGAYIEMRLKDISPSLIWKVLTPAVLSIGAWLAVR